jgi:hypothetical protein
VLNRRQERDVERAAEVVADAMLGAVARTVAEPGPGPARDTVAELAAYDERPEFGDGAPVRMMMFVALSGRCAAVRAELADTPERVDEVLVWIEEQLGPRFRARARYTAGMLADEAAATEAVEYVDALREDYLPSMVWLLAGAVARYGAGDVEWLRRLQDEEPEA